MAAADQIVFRFPRDRIRDSSALTVIARFRDRATDADVTPTNVQYRLDNITTGTEVVDWTAKAAATEVSIAITPTQNECTTSYDVQLMLLTVAADKDLATQFVEALEYEVRCLGLKAHQ